MRMPGWMEYTVRGRWEAWKRNGQAYGDIQGQAQVFELDFKNNGGPSEGCEQRDEVTGVRLQ